MSVRKDDLLKTVFVVMDIYRVILVRPFGMMGPEAALTRDVSRVLCVMGGAVDYIEDRSIDLYRD